MKISISRPFYKDSVTMTHESDDLNLPQVIELLVRPALLAMGYTEKTVTTVLGEVDYDAITTAMDEAEKDSIWKFLNES